MKKINLCVLVLLVAVLLPASVFATVLQLQDGLNSYDGTTDKSLYIGAVDDGSKEGLIGYSWYSATNQFNSLVRFNLSGVTVAGSDITSASIKLYVIDARADQHVKLGVHPLLRNFTEGAYWTGSSWNQSRIATPGYSSQWWQAGGAAGATDVGSQIGNVYDFVFSSATPNEWVSFDITNLVKDWLNGTKTNYGVNIMAKAYDASTNNGKLVYVNQENATAANRPMLEISYIPEPATMAILGLGSLILMRRRKA